ncbi:MAG: S9 family peptidase, partial [Candidatus Eremiobacteraeota bacterium]|nr:S9 family peptidase [Candidatus Eremiobacteraeota bacterium]
MKKKLASVLMLSLLATPAFAQDTLTYPDTNKIDKTHTYHGEEVPDPYFWLEDDRSKETEAWVKAENAVTDGYLEKIAFRPALKQRIKELMNYERVSAPSKHGDYQYFFKNDGLQNHSVLYRVPVSKPDAVPEVFLDPNTFSQDGTTGLTDIEFSEDGTLAAYLITEGGSDWRKVVVINTASKEQMEKPLEDVKFSGLAWRGNHGFYYSSYDNPDKADGSQLSSKTNEHKLLYHVLGTDQSKDRLIFGGSDRPTRYVGGYVTEDQRFLVVTAAQNTSGNQLFIKDLNLPNGDFVQIQDDYMATAEIIHNERSKFYMLTNIDAPNYRVVSFDLSHPDVWTDVIPETTNVLNAASGGGKLFGTYLVDAKTEVKQFDTDGKLERKVELPGIGTASGFSAKEYDDDLYYSFTSFTDPTTIYKYDIGSGKTTLYRRPKVDFNPDDYVTEQVFFNSKDGTRIPMFIVYKKGMEKNGKNPTDLYSYGGFNISLKPSFSSVRIAWLEAGGIFAMPNIRGGGEYGEKWHLAGTKMNKQNVFDDFAAAADYLKENNYTSTPYLAISGRSNGGLLVGATMTQKPNISKVALPGVGVLDMLRYHTFTAGAGWAADYGTAEDSPEMFQYLKGYSPYHNLKKGVEYPATLVTTADHDDRVVPAHSFKFAARLQEYHEGSNPVLIRIETKAGH